MTVPVQHTRTPEASVRRVAVPEREPLIGSAAYDYADSFELRVAEPDPRSAEELARFAIEHAPWPVRYGVLLAWRGLLRFRLGPLRAPDHILGARIVVSERDVIHLEVSGPLMRGAIVSRRIDPTRIVLTTYVFYERPALARFIWAITGGLHRRVASYLLTRTAATAKDTR